MKYSMTLEHYKNPDIGGYWEDPTDKKPIHIKENSLYRMKRIFRNWIESNGLGSGNVPYIIVKDEYGCDVGKFSYNGRFWECNEERVEISIGLED
tara:strand:- start:66 stop:350 length:285 start_codon:yes stop_codon:yes gene_type:complete